MTTSGGNCQLNGVVLIMNMSNPKSFPFVPPAWQDKPTPEQMREIFAEIEKAAAVRPKRIKDPALMDYNDQYLKTALWKRIKKRVLERDKSICQCCGGKGAVVHHRCYDPDVLRGENDAMLATVCSGCHDLIHLTDDGRKRTLEETDVEFLMGQRQTETPEIKVDLRTIWMPIPPGWNRLTHVQKRLWHERFLAAKKIKRQALDAHKESRLGSREAESSK